MSTTLPATATFSSVRVTAICGVIGLSQVGSAGVCAWRATTAAVLSFWDGPVLLPLPLPTQAAASSVLAPIAAQIHGEAAI